MSLDVDAFRKEFQGDEQAIFHIDELIAPQMPS